MLDRDAQLRILVASNRRSLDAVHWALESLEAGATDRTSYSSLQRAFHTIKHEASHLRLGPLARLAAACESLVEQALERRLGLPLDLLRRSAAEIRTATETLSAGGRHALDKALLAQAESAAKPGDAA